MNFLDNWYGYGEFVIDKILGTRRAETVNVYAPATPPSPEIVRTNLRVPRPLTIEITTIKPCVVCTLDEIVLMPNGQLYDLRTRSVYVDRRLVLELVTYNLSADDILKLYRLYLDFPEIDFKPPLVAYLKVSFTHLQSLRRHFDDLELLFLRHAPFTRWRSESASAWRLEQEVTSN